MGLFFGFMFLIIDISMAVFIKGALQTAVEEGVRRKALQPTTWPTKILYMARLACAGVWFLPPLAVSAPACGGSTERSEG